MREGLIWSFTYHALNKGFCVEITYLSYEYSKYGTCLWKSMIYVIPDQHTGKCVFFYCNKINDRNEYKSNNFVCPLHKIHAELSLVMIQLEHNIGKPETKIRGLVLRQIVHRCSSLRVRTKFINLFLCDL